jgi:hypothetical protein
VLRGSKEGSASPQVGRRGSMKLQSAKSSAGLESPPMRVSSVAESGARVDAREVRISGARASRSFAEIKKLADMLMEVRVCILCVCCVFFLCMCM